MNDTHFFNRLSAQKEKSLFDAVDLLNKWLDEILLQGVSSLQDDPEKLIEISTRMVDTGLQGIARKLRLIPEKIKESTDWTDFVFAQLAELYMFVRSVKRVDQLDELEKEDLLAYAGIVFKKTDFNDEQVLQDEWIYLGHQNEKEEKLIVRRNWFYGMHSKHICLFIEFQFSRFVQFKSFIIGNTYRSAVRYFPSKVYQRIKDIATDQIVKSDFQKIRSYNLNEMLDKYCNDLVMNPFIRHQCFLLHHIKIVRQSNRWFFTNDHIQFVELSNDESQLPTIVLYSSDPDTIYVCEYYNNRLKVISIFVKDFVIDC